MEPHQQQEPQPESDRSDTVLELNFVPQWARQPPAPNPYARFEGEGRPAERRGERRGERPARFGEKRDQKRRGDLKGRRPGPERPREFAGRRPAPSFEPAPARVPVTISFIPERDHLAAVVQTVRASGRAYPLMDLALRFLSDEAAYLVKIETRSAAKPVHLFQCKECQVAFFSRDALVAHATASHLESVFTREQVENEAPAGNYTCVARCRLSGILLGPPNYHGYNEKIQELWHKRYAHMSLDEYRRSIETVRDADLIERWKQEQRVQVLYRLKGKENAEALKPADAEKYFLEHCAASQVIERSRLILPAPAARRLSEPDLREAVRDAWAQESRRPASLMFALRPAFHHMRLNLFRAGGGIAFVTPFAPRPLQPQQAVQPIAEVLQFLKDHPGCARTDIVEQLRPGAAAESPEVTAVLSPLRWLIERGHVIEFFNGTLSVPGWGAPKSRRG